MMPQTPAEWAQFQQRMLQQTEGAPLDDGGVRGPGNQRPSRPLMGSPEGPGGSDRPGRAVYLQQSAAHLAAFRAKLGL